MAMIANLARVKKTVVLLPPGLVLEVNRGYSGSVLKKGSGSDAQRISLFQTRCV